MYTYGYKRRCYLVLSGFIVDYKEQILITGLKQTYNPQFAMFYQKKEN